MSFDHLLPSSDIATKSGRVAVLMGGTSAEREVSLTSGSFVLKALVDAGVDAFKVDVQKNVLDQLGSLKADRVINMLHGRGGEDGEVQAILDVLKIPYTGSGVKASSVTMDKLMTKRLLLGSQINTPEFMQLKTLEDCLKAIKAIGLPLIIKPVNEGSSIGMSKAEKADELEAAFLLASRYGTVMAEQWVTGSEYTVAWLEDTVLPAIKLETPHVFYDYDAKYKANDTRYICPCGLDEKQLKKLNDIVTKTIDVCGMRHWGRVDLMLNQQGDFQVIEANTIPGMTDHSLVPMAAKQAGLSFQQLVLKLIELTLKPEVADV
ncbi:MAG: D-alanine--D-alanine ligase [Gammaproteobacteria bacterium]|jgi:D-alanine-D-alanine ligase|nr:D-alanine--D-alanine ligase [Gammaproteobacteria bacterium]MBT3725547.1 D-alanine--D-alanine ligase [Gammaproteobacteria bacterium]MBT4077054.1 D-alanine--D-alanine ligase [Gammaproteobacteria bacterium]MBT4193337.1 D-alanine--D-alanine ligase [Gammaproteobacteria bacterium]MBT4449157.1 D-alanine--D-alanine ligase [Gammaproteobacteria bacterium]